MKTVEETLCGSCEDSHASLFPWLESKRGKTTIATSGRRCYELSERLRRVGLSVRTYLESCELPPGKWCRIWSVKDITSSCLILKLRLSELRTDENESRSSQNGAMRWLENITGPDGQPKMWKTPVTAASGNRQFYRNSRGEANLAGMVKLWPTPAARDCKGSNSMEHLTRESGHRNHVDQLANAVKLLPTTKANGATGPSNPPNRQGAPDLQSVAGGQLNPTWVEWLMGFPIGWTDLNASETP